jgi:hypothetical protein
MIQRYCAVLMMVSLSCSLASAATFTSTGSTNWSAAGTWSPAGGPPSSSDNAIIRANDTVTVDTASCVCGTLTLGDGNTGAPAKINFGVGAQMLTVSGATTFGNGPSQGSIDMTSANSTLSTGSFVIATGPANFTGGSGTVVLTSTNPLPNTIPSFNNLTIASGTTTQTGDMNPILGNLLISTGATFNNGGASLSVNGTTTVNGTIQYTGGGNLTGAVTVNGTWSDTVGANVTFKGGLTVPGSLNAAGGTYTFTTNSPVFSGNATIHNLALSGITGFTFTNNGNLTVSNISGSGPESFVQGAGSNLTISGGITNIATLDFQAAGNTVTFSGSAQTVPTGMVNNKFVNLVITGTASLANGTPSTGTLTVANGATFTVPTAQITVTGTTTVDGTLSYPDGGSVFGGAVTVSSTGTIQWQTILDGDIGTFQGPVTINGTWNDMGGTGPAFSPDFQNGLTVNGTFTTATGGYIFDTNNQSFNGNATIHNVTLGSSITLTNNGTLTASNSLAGSGMETFAQGANSTLNFAGSSLTGLVAFTANTAGNTVNYNGTSTQTVAAASYYNLKISTTGASSAVLFASGTINVAGNFDSSAANPASGWGGAGNTIVFNGTTPQMIVGGPSLVDANNIALANPAGVTLSGNDFMVAGNLQFGMGNLNTGTFKLRRDNTAVPAPTSTGASASSHIVGNELVYFGSVSGSGASFTFSVGDATALARVAVSNLNVTTAGSLVVSAVAGNDPNIATSGLDPTRTAARFWKLSTPDGLAGTFDSVFNFNASDVTAGNPSSFVAMRFNGSTWSPATVSNAGSASTTVTGISSSALGEFQLGQVAGPNPLLASGGVTITGNPVVGQQLTFTGVATDPSGYPLTYNWDFGDGTTASGAFVQHVYNTAGNFTITLMVTNGGSSASIQIPITILGPPTNASGVPNIATTQNEPPVTNVLNGISISVSFSDGGIIGLSIDINALIRDAFTVSTDFSGTDGSLGTRGGTSPVFQFNNSGVFVATSSASDSTTNALAGKARKSLAIGDQEVGIATKYKNGPKSPKIKTGKIGGKFSFTKGTAASTGKADTVTYSGSFELPEGLDLTSKPTFSFAIGNIMDSIAVDSKGKGFGSSTAGFIKKIQVKYPKLPKGSTVTGAGQTATFTVTVSGVNLSGKGFDTEGISASVLPSEKSLKTVPRSIQVVMVFGGAAYDGTANVDFKLASNGDSGTMGTRR